MLLLIKENYNYSSHNGVKTEFHKSFVKTRIISKDSGRTYNRLFNLRQEGDYIDFQRFSKEEIEPVIVQAKDFIAEIEKFITTDMS